MPSPTFSISTSAYLHFPIDVFASGYSNIIQRRIPEATMFFRQHKLMASGILCLPAFFTLVCKCIYKHQQTKIFW